ncbi:hypothetical protein CEXT_563651 [Caerostris extrusa]|uniref:Uncharacterized protein n=1 Tax=Caerostris extrusa TaxID=172846 RepID=A0AAV4XRD8_CAEEX|nr:hypothetical protein CEXT_563651 [Caerostris extrusa]
MEWSSTLVPYVEEPVKPCSQIPKKWEKQGMQSHLSSPFRAPVSKAIDSKSGEAPTHNNNKKGSCLLDKMHLLDSQSLAFPEAWNCHYRFGRRENRTLRRRFRKIQANCSSLPFE